MVTGTLKIKIAAAGTHRTLTVTKVTATLGSAAHADVRVGHPSVDPEHARLWLEGGRLWLQDLGSRHGSVLNGTRLPALKPMLVRPTDVLKLGSADEEMTFAALSASPVRAPRVSAPQPTPEPDPAPDDEETSLYDMTTTDIRPSPFAHAHAAAPAATPAPAAESGGAREERARVARELAELRLQLQMADLERTGVDDLRKHVNQLRAEIRALEDEGRELTAELARRRDEETERKRAFEADLVERRTTAEREVREMRDVQGRKLGHWKLDSVSELNKQTHAMLLEKVRAWVTRPLSQDMVFELEHELDAVFRGVLLEEDPHGGTVGEVTRTQVSLPTQATFEPAFEAATSSPASEATVIVARPTEESQIRMALGSVVARRPNTLGRRVVTTGLLVAVLGLALEVYRVTHGTNMTSVTGGTSVTGASARLPAAQPWRPQQDARFRNRYVDDVVFTKGYAELMTSAGWRSAWTAELEHAAPPWKIDPRVITTLAEREVNLVAELRTMRDRTPEGQQDGALLEMRAREAEVAKLMLADLGGNAAVLAKYQALRRTVLARLLPH